MSLPDQHGRMLRFTSMKLAITSDESKILMTGREFKLPFGKNIMGIFLEKLPETVQERCLSSWIINKTTSDTCHYHHLIEEDYPLWISLMNNMYLFALKNQEINVRCHKIKYRSEGETGILQLKGCEFDQKPTFSLIIQDQSITENMIYGYLDLDEGRRKEFVQVKDLNFEKFELRTQSYSNSGNNTKGLLAKDEEAVSEIKAEHKDLLTPDFEQSTENSKQLGTVESNPIKFTTQNPTILNGEKVLEQLEQTEKDDAIKMQRSSEKESEMQKGSEKPNDSNKVISTLERKVYTEIENGAQQFPLEIFKKALDQTKVINNNIVNAKNYFYDFIIGSLLKLLFYCILACAIVVTVKLLVRGIRDARQTENSYRPNVFDTPI